METLTSGSEGAGSQQWLPATRLNNQPTILADASGLQSSTERNNDRRFRSKKYVNDQIARYNRALSLRKQLTTDLYDAKGNYIGELAATVGNSWSDMSSFRLYKSGYNGVKIAVRGTESKHIKIFQTYRAFWEVWKGKKYGGLIPYAKPINDNQHWLTFTSSIWAQIRVLDAPTNKIGAWRYYSDNSAWGYTGSGTTIKWIFDDPNIPAELLKEHSENLYEGGATKSKITMNFDTFIEYKGRIVGRVVWSASATWKLGNVFGGRASVSSNLYKIHWVGGAFGDFKTDHQMVLNPNKATVPAALTKNHIYTDQEVYAFIRKVLRR